MGTFILSESMTFTFSCRGVKSWDFSFDCFFAFSSSCNFVLFWSIACRAFRSVEFGSRWRLFWLSLAAVISLCKSLRAAVHSFHQPRLRSVAKAINREQWESETFGMPGRDATDVDVFLALLLSFDLTRLSFASDAKLVFGSFATRCFPWDEWASEFFWKISSIDCWFSTFPRLTSTPDFTLGGDDVRSMISSTTSVTFIFAFCKDDLTFVAEFPLDVVAMKVVDLIIKQEHTLSAGRFALQQKHEENGLVAALRVEPVENILWPYAKCVDNPRFDCVGAKNDRVYNEYRLHWSTFVDTEHLHLCFEPLGFTAIALMLRDKAQVWIEQ